MTSHALVWFRQDLRLADNPALHDALKRGYSVVPVYIHAPGEEGKWPPGGATRFWLHQSLKSLSADLHALESKLTLRSAESSLDELRKLVEETGSTAVFWNRRYEPAAIERDTKIKEALSKDGIEVHSYNASLLFEPWTIMNKSDKPFKVFTPFWRHCISLAEPPEPLNAPDKIKSPAKFPKSEKLNEWKLEPVIKWAEGIRQAWTPGEKGAEAQVEKLLRDVLEKYGEGRNRPDRVGVSRISPHLHFGEIGPRQIWHRVKDEVGTSRGAKSKEGAQIYLKEIIWREFAYHLLFHFPHTDTAPLDEKFHHFPYKRDARALKRWQKGLTGYPLVDAGMRELWTTGWMHNRVRMVVGSFLVKDLLLPWQAGAKWFWDTLVDADLAANTMGWQWVAGCGADAAPYYRVFNPVLQGKKFDPDGDYVRKWVPELAALAGDKIHTPWLLSDAELEQAGIVLGDTYPRPIVDHSVARLRALNALKSIKEDTILK
ncbi:MAG TPA: deoxyribodipyrimidine photo-lyase [Drouetiella sp.]|jgi:deoxyribodipyrimidine photo-lyase